MQAFDLLSSLRAATAGIHKSLEQTPISKIIMSPDVSVNAYCDYLKKTWIIHHETEQQVFPLIAGIVPDSGSRLKSPAIANDLHSLSCTTPSFSGFIDASYRNRLPFAMGMMYVTEGSTLGGMYILKNIKTVLGDPAANATAFLNVYGERTGSCWKNFLGYLQNYQLTLPPEEKEELVAGAVYGFERTAFIFTTTIEEQAHGY